MISILIVEDDGEKKRALSETVLACPGLTAECITFAGDVHEAKVALKGKGFDLMLLDLNLPKRADQHPVPEGGLEILRWLKTRGKDYRPPYIVGTSAYPDAIRNAGDDFDNLLWQLIAFNYGDNEWRVALSNSVNLLVDELAPPFKSDGKSYKTDVLIVTALIEPELTALWDWQVDWQDVTVRNDDSRYRRCQIPVEDGHLSVVATAASDKGLTGAAVAVTKGIYSFRPRYVVMAGICAGLEKRTNLGDVVVTELCWDWGSGKIKVEKGIEVFHPAPYQFRLDEGLSNAFKKLREDNKLFDNLGLIDPNGKLKVAPRLLVGPVASGASVLQSSAAMKRVLDQHKDLLALEMEIFSVFFACHTAPHPRPIPFALKGVCDFGNERKKDGHQKIAAALSATALLRFLKSAIKPLGVM